MPLPVYGWQGGSKLVWVQGHYLSMRQEYVSIYSSYFASFWYFVWCWVTCGLKWTAWWQSFSLFQEENEPPRLITLICDQNNQRKEYKCFCKRKKEKKTRQKQKQKTNKWAHNMDAGLFSYVEPEHPDSFVMRSSESALWNQQRVVRTWGGGEIQFALLVPVKFLILWRNSWTTVYGKAHGSSWKLGVRAEVLASEKEKHTNVVNEILLLVCRCVQGLFWRLVERTCWAWLCRLQNPGVSGRKSGMVLLQQVGHFSDSQASLIIWLFLSLFLEHSCPSNFLLFPCANASSAEESFEQPCNGASRGALSKMALPLNAEKLETQDKTLNYEPKDEDTKYFLPTDIKESGNNKLEGKGDEGKIQDVETYDLQYQGLKSLWFCGNEIILGF